MGPRELPVVTAAGEPAQIGQQLGEVQREAIRESLELVRTELAAVGNVQDVEQSTLRYLPAIEAVSPELVAEIRGLAAGARISITECLLLQLRFEAVGYGHPRTAAEARVLAAHRGLEGCTSFALHHPRGRYAGQNVDLPPAHVRMGWIVRLKPADGPDLLYYSYYAGLLGYVGINSEGLAVFGNALLAPGWRVGFPRYLLLRQALQQRTVTEVDNLLHSIHRASTINLLVTDRSGEMADFELAVDEHARLATTDNTLLHTNHYLDPHLRSEDELLAILPDSPARYRNGRLILESQSNDPMLRVRRLLSDHTDGPASICRHAAAAGAEKSWVTVASLIAQPDSGELHVAAGNPCQHSYVRYTL